MRLMGIALSLGLIILSVEPVVAASEGSMVSPVRAVLEGRPIPVDRIARFHCHDFDFPIITCFRSAAHLDSATRAAVSTRSADSSVSSAALAAADYVTIYSLSNYQGSSMNLSQDYTGLFAIGWNDTVSSYRARNGYSGTFYSEWFAGGAATTFCCYVNVGTLPAAKDNTFSSVYRN